MLFYQENSDTDGTVPKMKKNSEFTSDFLKGCRSL